MPFHQSSATSPVSPGPIASAARSNAGSSAPGGATRLEEPREHVADGGLPCLVAVEAGQDPVAHDAGDAGQAHLALIDDEIADRGPHHHHERSGRLHAGARDRDERIDVADRHRHRLGEAEPSSDLRPQRPGARPERRELGPELRRRLLEAGIGGVEVLDGRQPFLRGPHRLVAGGAALAPLDAGQVPDDPVGRLDEPVAGVVDLAVLEPQLDQLREVPLGGDAPAVAREEGLRAFRGNLVEAVGDRLGGVVLPQLRPRVAPAAPALLGHQRGAVAGHGQDGAGGEVDTEADDVLARGRHLLEHRRDRLLEHRHPVVRVLERPVGRQLLGGPGQLAVDHPVRIADLADRGLRSAGEVEQQRAARLRAEVDADRVSAAPHRDGVGGAPRAASAAIASSRARRYSSTTICVSSSTEVSAVGLSSPILPSWIRLTRSQVASTCT